jgi:hypothetical protein
LAELDRARGRANGSRLIAGQMAADAFAVMREDMKGKVGSGSSRSTAGSTSSPCDRTSVAS